MNRLQRVAQHVIAGTEAPPKLSAEACSSLAEAAKGPDDVVICCALRTAICKAKRGNFKDMACEDLLGAVMKEVVERTKVDPKAIEDIQIGNASQPGAGAITSRMAQFLAGLPFEVPLQTVNRQCSSGLQATANVAAAIKAGIIDVGLAGGVESMSNFGMMDGVDPNKFSGAALDNELAQRCLMPMGLTSENVAKTYDIPREVQDKMAEHSHAKALAAQKAGFFDAEIVPVEARVKDKAGNVTKVVVAKDEGPRAGTTAKSLGGLRPAFKAHGSTTAGNSSQVSDGAACVLLARRSVAEKMKLPIIGRFVSYACVGVDPAHMGIGPAFAIPAALEKAGLKTSDIDVYEINEAFASQATMSIDHLKIPMEKVNPKGGAIALGHPLGCTGARQVATLLHHLHHIKKPLGCISMCIGTGMGAAAIFEAENL